MPLPPPLPVEERRSAFVSLPTSTTASSFSIPTRLARDSSQPINLSLTEQVQARPAAEPTAVVAVATGTEQRQLVPQPQLSSKHRSVIKTALLSSTPQQHCSSESSRLPPAAQRYLSTASLDITFDWGQTQEYAGTGEARETCSARLISMAQRAQQQQLEQKQLLSPLASSPVKEATDALMLLQETTSF